MSRWLVLAPASPTIGFGHVARSLVLVDAIRDRGDSATLVTTPDVASQGGEASDLKRVALDDWTPRTLGDLARSADIVLLDAPDATLERLGWTTTVARFVAAFRIHDLDDGAAPFEDVSLTPTFATPSVTDTRHGGRRRRHWRGRDLIVIRASCFATDTDVKETPPHVLVTMGGADPLGLTTVACEGLTHVAPAMRVTVVVGRLNPAYEHLRERFGSSFSVKRQGEIEFDTSLRRATLALVNAGLTRYECIAARTPFVALSMDAQQAAITEQVVGAGFGWHAGIGASTPPEAVATIVSNALSQPETISSMRLAASTMVDAAWPRHLVARLDSVSHDQA